MIAEFAAILLRTTGFLAGSAVIAALWIRWRRPNTPLVHQVVWMAVLAQGILWARIPMPLLNPTPDALIPATVSSVTQIQPDFTTREVPGSQDPTSDVSLQKAHSSGQPANDQGAASSKSEVTALAAPTVFPWVKIAIVGWLVGVLAILVQMIWASRRFAKTLAADSLHDVPADWQAEWRRLQSKSAVARPIPMIVTKSIGPLFVWRLRGGDFVVPHEEWSQWSPAERHAVMRHELSHYRRSDALWFFAARLLACVHWFNPLAWLAVRKFELAAEWACDIAAAPTLADRPAYARLLLSLTQSKTPALMVHAVGAPPLAQRIQLLLAHQKEDTMFRRILTITIPIIALAAASVQAVPIQTPTSNNGTEAPSVSSIELPDNGNTMGSQEKEKPAKDKDTEQKNGRKARKDRIAKESEPILKEARKNANSPENKRRENLRRGKDAFKYYCREFLSQTDLDSSALLDLCLNFLRSRPSEDQAISAWTKLGQASWKGNNANEIRSELEKIMTQKSDHKFYVRMREAREKILQNWGDDPDWRVRKDYWLDTVSTFLAAVKAKSPSSVGFTWRGDRSHSDVDDARQSYLAALVLIADGRALDSNLMKMFEANGTVAGPGEFELRYFSALNAMAKAKIPLQPIDWDLLLKKRIANAGRGWFREASEYYKTLAKRSPENAERMLDDFSRHFAGYEYAEFLNMTGLPVAKVDERLLSQPTSINAQSVPFSKVIETLAETRAAGFWMDANVRKDSCAITLKMENAKLINVIQEVGKQAKFEVQQFPGRMVWIGPKTRFSSAQEEYVQSVGKTKHATDPLKGRLFQVVSLQYPRSIPLSEVFDFLRDYNQVNIIALSPLPEQPASIEVNSLPMPLWLTRLTQIAKLDWIVQGNAIYLGKRSELDNLTSRLMRKVEATGKIKRMLEKTIDLQYNDTPFSEVTNFLSDFHRVKFELVNVKSPPKIALTISEVTTRELLDLICFQLNLEWRIDGETILIGSKADLDARESKAKK